MSGATPHPHPSFSAFIPRNKEQQTRWLARPVPEVIADLLVQANRFTFNGKNILKLRQSVANNHTSQNPEEEVRYERLLVMSNPNELYNQFAFHGKIAVDLVRVQGNYLTHLFELKTGSNNLRYGVYELVYYYFLLRRAQEENKAISFLNKPNTLVRLANPLILCVLVPQEWEQDTPFLRAVQQALLEMGNPRIYRQNLLPDWKAHLEMTQRLKAWITPQ